MNVLDLIPRASELEAVDVPQGSDEWLAARRSGIGGSEVVRVLTEPWRLWQEKRGEREAFGGNNLTRVGLEREGFILQHFIEDHPGAELIRPVPFLRDRVHPWRVASLDGLVRFGHVAVVDAKYSLQDWHGQVSPGIWLQQMWYCALTGLPESWVAKEDGRGEREAFRLPYNEAEFAPYLAAVDAFGEANLIGGKAPDPSEDEAGERALADMRERSLVPRMDATGLMLAVEAELARVDREAKAAKARADELKGRVAEQMALHGVRRIDFPDGSRWSYVERSGSVNWQAYALSLGGSKDGASAFVGKGSSFVTTKHAEEE